MTRVLKTLVTLVGLIGTFIVLGGGFASADPNWQTVVETSNFHCSAQYQHPTYEITVQTCVVVNGSYTQSVAVVANRSFTAVPIEDKHLELIVNDTLSYDRSCLPSTLSGGYTRACFGPTQTRPCSAVVRAYSYVEVAGVGFAVYSPYWKMCS